MKKILFNPENPNGLEIKLTDADISQREADEVEFQTNKSKIEEAEAQTQALKDSAKAKLIAGEALTEDEANTIVL